MMTTTRHGEAETATGVTEVKAIEDDEGQEAEI